MPPSDREYPLLEGAINSETHASSSKYFALLLLQSFAFFLTFAAFNAAQSLNGSIPSPPGLAPVQFMAIYIVFALVAIPAPKLLSVLGPKLSMVLGMAPYVGLSASFLSPPMCTAATADWCWTAESIWILRIATGVLLGLGAPILWTGQGVYLARLAAHEANAAPNIDDAERAERLSQAIKRFNGAFFSAFQFSGFAGLLGSSLVLVFVKSSSATFYLFIGLTVLCAAGVLCIVFLLPALGEVATDAETATLEDPAAPLKPRTESEVTILSTLYLCADPRMLLIVPNILYNGLSLGFIWYLYNTFVFNTALGTSFVGFGAAAGYLANSIATQAMSSLAAKCGQLPTMTLATVLQLIFYVLVLWYQVKPVQCLPSGCAADSEFGTQRLSCFNGTDALPLHCKEPSSNVSCAACEPYEADSGQVCGVGWKQCEWLHGDAEDPEPADVAFMLIAAIVFMIGDAVWESQVPAVLQTLFDAGSGQQPAAMANLKLWQALGIGAMFGLAQLNNLHVAVYILVVGLVLSSVGLLLVHTRVANLDSGKMLERGRRP